MDTKDLLETAESEKTSQYQTAAGTTLAGSGYRQC